MSDKNSKYTKVQSFVHGHEIELLYDTVDCTYAARCVAMPEVSHYSTNPDEAISVCRQLLDDILFHRRLKGIEYPPSFRYVLDNAFKRIYGGVEHHK